MNKILYTILFLVVTLASVMGQTQKQYIKAAEESFAAKNYYQSLMYYQEAVAFEDDNIDLRYMLAEASRKFMSYSLAEQNYQYVKDNDTENTYPLATYYLAEVMQRQGKYTESKEMFDLYLSENNGDDAYYTFKADKERKASEWALTEIDAPDETIKVANAGASVNTVYSDFGPTINGDELYFSSMRFASKSATGEKVSKVLKASIPDDFEGTIGSGELIEGDLNSNAGHTANTAFNKDKSKIFYTVCERINGEDIRCDLYCRKIDEDGNLGEGMKLPDFVNAEGFTSTHPTVGYDEERDKEVLYFASDREGGKGKLDIWYSIIDNKDNFTKPMNLEDINTKEDELTPFYHIPSNTLYFSSDGYRTLGGYDVFSSAYTSQGYGEPIHLNNPLNSSYHDIYFVMADDEESGYFATNREGAQFIDNIQKACCFDIYKVKFEPLELNLNALTYDKISQGDLPGATVKLINEDTGELIGEITNDSGIDHKFQLERCTNYIIVAEKPGYKSDTIRYSTCGLKKSQDITKKLYLEPDLLELDVLTFDEATKANLNGCTVTLTDLSDPDAAPIVIPNMTTNDWNFKLIRGHKYTITATKPGYYPASVDVITENIAGTKIVKKLYLKQDLVQSYSGKLYFHNDRPNQNSVATTTTKTYKETYDKYLSLRPRYESRSGDPTGISSFFDNQVIREYNDFLEFLRAIEPELIAGKTYEITIRGHASPLSQTNYNLFLTSRRVASMVNEIRAFNGGSLSTYVGTEPGSRLMITEVSYGESLAPAGISDSRSDTKASIYSVEASRERRVEIIQVTRQEN
ncbi:hypothetical protein N9B82_03465 [Saprospiraceae bacterium]|nr:hypothetical protein [Saprospiraceae bacterium]